MGVERVERIKPKGLLISIGNSAKPDMTNPEQNPDQLQDKLQQRRQNAVMAIKLRAQKISGPNAGSSS